MAENLASLSTEAKSKLAHVVVIDHERGTEIYGTDSQGEVISERFKSFGNLPWTAVLGALVQHTDWTTGEPGIHDLEPDTGYDRYTLPAIVH